jgi:hypothetical protein
MQTVLTLMGVDVLSLAVRNLQGRRVFLLEMVHYVPLIVCQDKHTNSVGVRSCYESLCGTGMFDSLLDATY